MRILAVGAHPDDLETYCAGTLAKYVKRGDEVFMSYLCNGDKGHTQIPSKKLAEVRKAEARKAAKVIGARVLGGYFPDMELYPDQRARHRVADLMRTVQPELIITHAPDDYMADHNATSRLVTDASFLASLPNYKSSRRPTKTIPPIFFMDTSGGMNFQPTEYVDITREMPIKEKMLLCHQSQFGWAKEHHHIDLVGFMKELAEFRGIQCGVEYAEGFVQYSVWGRMATRRLLPQD